MEKACPCLTICTAVLPEDPKLVIIAVPEGSDQEEDRRPGGGDLSGIQLPAQHETSFITGKRCNYSFWDLLKWELYP